MSLSWQHCTHFYYSPLSLCLTAAAHVTHLSTRTHTYRDIWTTANQRGGPPFTISDWFRPRYKPNGGLFLNHRTGDTFFSFLEWLDAPVRPGIFVSRTREKLGCTCDQIGRTLEPWRCIIGLRSGDCGGHLSKVNSLSCSRNQSEMIWALWHGALAC